MRVASASGKSSDGKRAASSTDDAGAKGSGGARATATRRSKLQLQCSDGSLFDVTHEEAMMSSTLWMLLQDVSETRRNKPTVRQHMIPIYDVPSASVELALYYCRCLYKQQVEGIGSAMHDWEDRFYNLDSKTLCDLAKVASNLDIQPLVDITCRSIAQIMSATEAAHEIRQKFGLDDGPELPRAMAGFDFDMFNSLDHDLSTDEYDYVDLDQDQPSVDELVNFINGDSGKPSSTNGSRSGKNQASPITGNAATATEGGASSSSKKKKKKKKKKKTTGSGNAVQAGETQDGNDEEDVDGDGDDIEEMTVTQLHTKSALQRARDLQQKMRLAQENPSAVFQESEFEDDDDEELDEQIESFRLALESAHLESKPAKLKPRVDFAPQDVFRNRLVQAQR